MQLMPFLTVKDFLPQEAIFRGGDRPTECFVITKGSALIHADSLTPPGCKKTRSTGRVKLSKASCGTLIGYQELLIK